MCFRSDYDQNNESQLGFPHNPSYRNLWEDLGHSLRLHTYQKAEIGLW